jgi:hypothetical protein
LGSLSFIAYFFQDALDDDVQHIDAHFRLRDVWWHLGFSLIVLPKGFITFFVHFAHSQIINAN